MDDTKSVDLPRRRVMLAGIGAAGVVAVLAGCGSSGGSSTGSTGATGGSDATGDTGPTDSGSTASNGGGDAIKVSDIPTGGGKIFATQNVVVTQPTAGDFKAFSATCTHQGCKVSKVQDGTIDCPCHGSQYSITDGSVKAGPAPRPLPTRTVTVNGDSLTVS
jgi:Rieske Fe-S protein